MGSGIDGNSLTPIKFSFKFTIGGEKHKGDHHHEPFNVKSALVNTGIALATGFVLDKMNQKIEGEKEGISPVFVQHLDRMQKQIFWNVAVTTATGTAFAAIRGENIQNAIQTGIQSAASETAAQASRMAFAQYYDNTVAAVAANLAYSTAISARDNLAWGDKPFHKLTYNVGPAYFDIYPKGYDDNGRTKFQAQIDPIQTIGLGIHAGLNVAGSGGFFDVTNSIKNLTPVFQANDKHSIKMHDDANGIFIPIAGSSITYRNAAEQFKSVGGFSRDYTTSDGSNKYNVRNAQEFINFVEGPLKYSYRNAADPEYFVNEVKHQTEIFNHNNTVKYRLDYHSSSNQFIPGVTQTQVINGLMVHEGTHLLDYRRNNREGRYLTEQTDNFLHNHGMPSFLSLRGTTGHIRYGFDFIADKISGNSDAVGHESLSSERTAYSSETLYSTHNNLYVKYTPQEMGLFFDKSKGDKTPEVILVDAFGGVSINPQYKKYTNNTPDPLQEATKVFMESGMKAGSSSVNKPAGPTGSIVRDF